MGASFDTRTALHFQATVQPGNKIELASEQLREGENVEVFLVIPRRADRLSQSVVDFLDSLPPGPRSGASWEEVERAHQQELNSLDR